MSSRNVVGAKGSKVVHKAFDRRRYQGFDHREGVGLSVMPLI